jgi:hypothetical protein
MILSVSMLQTIAELSNILFSRYLTRFIQYLINCMSSPLHLVILPFSNILIVDSNLNPFTFCHIFDKLPLKIACFTFFFNFRKFTWFVRACYIFFLFAFIIFRRCLEMKFSMSMFFIIFKAANICNFFLKKFKFTLSISMSMLPCPFIIPLIF